jgi:hypothetical protein
MRLNLRFLDDKDVQDSVLLSRLRTQFVDTERLIALPFELGDFGCWKRREWASDQHPKQLVSGLRVRFAQGLQEQLHRLRFARSPDLATLCSSVHWGPAWELLRPAHP